MKSVYTGGEKVAEFESYDEFRVGDSKPAFIYEGNELVYPNPVKDGLVLWYDFSGRTNADAQRGIAEDLSGNGNRGTLQNFNYTSESGYDKNKLLFDGVDDYIDAPSDMSSHMTTASTVETTVYVVNGVEQYPRLFSTATGSLGRGGIAIYLDKYTDTYFQLTAMVEGNGNIRRGEFDFNKTYHIVHVYTEDFRSILYINGEHIDTIQFTQKMPISSNAVIGWDKAFINARYGKEHFNSFKIYNRPLTPEEIAHNYTIEKERFSIE